MAMLPLLKLTCTTLLQMTSFIVVLLYWILLYTPGSTVVDPRTVLEHGGAFAYQLVDTVVTNPPIYLKHMLSVRRATVFIPASVCLLVQDDSVAA